MTIARKTIEERYGAVGSGAKVVFLKGAPVSLARLARRMALSHSDMVPIDAGTLADARHWIRFYDGEQRKVIAIEFDDDLNFLAECGADIMDWLGDEYFRIHWRVFCPAGGEEWLGGDMAHGRKA